MEIVNGSIVMEAVGVRHIVASFSFDSFDSGIGFVGFGVQFLNDVLRKLVDHNVPVHCEIDPIALAELDEYDASIIVKMPDADWVARLWSVMVYLSMLMSDVAESETGDLVAWATYEEMGALS